MAGQDKPEKKSKKDTVRPYSTGTDGKPGGRREITGGRAGRAPARRAGRGIRDTPVPGVFRWSSPSAGPAEPAGGTSNKNPGRGARKNRKRN